MLIVLFHAIGRGYQADSAGTVNRGGIWYGLGCLVATLLVAGTFYAYEPAKRLEMEALSERGEPLRDIHVTAETDPSIAQISGSSLVPLRVGRVDVEQ